jgi:hypothetical protein
LQGIASTPFLAGLVRTLPQLTPGLSPDLLAVAFREAQSSPDSLSATAASPLGDSPASRAAAASPESTAGSEQSQTKAEQRPAAGSATQQLEAAVPVGPVDSEPEEVRQNGDRENAWAGLDDISPGPRSRPTQPSDVMAWESPSGSLPSSAASSRPAAAASAQFAAGMGGSVLPLPGQHAIAHDGSAKPNHGTAAAAAAAPANDEDGTGTEIPGHKKRVSWGSNSEHTDRAAADSADSAGAQVDTAKEGVQDAESVASASPAVLASAAGQQAPSPRQESEDMQVPGHSITSSTKAPCPYSSCWQAC